MAHQVKHNLTLITYNRQLISSSQLNVHSSTPKTVPKPGCIRASSIAKSYLLRLQTQT